MVKRKSKIEKHILDYFEKKKSSVTFLELYASLGQFSRQGIRMCIYDMMNRGMVEKIGSEKTGKIGPPTAKFKLKK